MSDFLSSISAIADDPLKAIFGGADPKINRNVGTSDFRNAIMNDGIQRTNRFQLELIIPDKVQKHPAMIGSSAGFTESAFKAEEKKDVPNVFSKDFWSPDKSQPAVQPSQLKTLNLKCIKVSMPPKSIQQIKMECPGGDFKFATKVNHEAEMSASFILSKDSRELRLLNGWMNAVYNQRTGRVAYYDDYVAAELRVYPLDERDDQNYVFIFEDVWPSSITVPSFDATTGSDAADITVGFSYRRFMGLNQSLSFPGIPKETLSDQLRGISGAIGSVTQGIEKLKGVKNLF